jgi:SAM-dependent methyltransferase
MTEYDHADLYDLFYEWKDYVAESAKIRGIVQERNPDAKTLLDVACGTGVHLGRLRQWYEVEGLDRSERMLAVARDRLAGVPLHRGDMLEFDLGKTFDVVTCLFSSIGYVLTVENLERAVATMARHLAPGGVLIVEPWFAPADFDPHHLGRLIVVERPDMHAVRMNGSRTDGTLSSFDFHFMIGRPGSVEHRTEIHTLGLFERDQYRAAFERAGLAVEHDEEGLMGRGLWIGRRAGDGG